jgi:hypothetical protein
VIDEGTAVHVNMEVTIPVLTGIIQVCIVTCEPYPHLSQVTIHNWIIPVSTGIVTSMFT